MISNVRAAASAGWDVLDPLSPSKGQPQLTHLRAGRFDYVHGIFVSEKDFAGWMLAHNIVLCDLGAGTHELLWKGERRLRQSAEDCGTTMWRGDTGGGASGSLAAAAG